MQASSGRDGWLALLVVAALSVGAVAAELLAVDALAVLEAALDEDALEGVEPVAWVPCAVDAEEEHPADARSSATTIA